MSLQKPSLAIGGIEPTTAKVGDLWYNTELNELRVYKAHYWMICLHCTVCGVNFPSDGTNARLEDLEDLCPCCSQEQRLDHVTKRYNTQSQVVTELKREIGVLRDDLKLAREANDLVAAIQRALPVVSDMDRAFFKSICYMCRDEEFQVEFIFRPHEDMARCAACEDEGFEKKTDIMLRSSSSRIGHTPDSVGGVTVMTCYQRLRSIYGSKIALERFVQALAPLLPEA